jgi:SAM-dependent methyltransferase
MRSREVEKMSEASVVDWQQWMARWDAMQQAYIPEREARFTLMLDVLEIVLPEAFVAVDLACGPGSISQRLLARFPAARCIALDYDPVLLELGRSVLGTQGGRLRWVEADLRDAAWRERLGEPGSMPPVGDLATGGVQVDAVLSTTALHWLEAGDLARLYGQLGELVRPGGVVLNGDHLRFAPALPTFGRIAAELKRRQHEQTFGQGSVEGWADWWSALGQEASVRELLAERARRFPQHTDDDRAPILELHEAALRDAGFREVGVLWRNSDDGVLLAVR